MRLPAFMFGAGYIVWTNAACLDPITIENGQVLKSGGRNYSETGQKLQVICDTGYRLLEGSFIECSLNGTWTTNASCIEEYHCNVYLTTGRGTMGGIYYRFAGAKFTASSTASPANFYGPENALPTTQESNSHSGGWVAGNNTANEYIQAEFVTRRRIMEIRTGGRYKFSPPQYVTSFYVYYSRDCAHFSVVTDTDGNPLNFTGNSDETYLKSSFLPYLVLARCIRINPTSWNNRIALRLAVVGCDFCKGFEIQHGYASATIIHSITTVKLSCESGYELSAYNHLTCLENGSWSSEQSYCKLPDKSITTTSNTSNGESTELTIMSLGNTSLSSTMPFTKQWVKSTTPPTMIRLVDWHSSSPFTTTSPPESRKSSAKSTPIQSTLVSSSTNRTHHQTKFASALAITTKMTSLRKIPKTKHSLKSPVTTPAPIKYSLMMSNITALLNVTTGTEQNVSFLHSKILPIVMITFSGLAWFAAFRVCAYVLLNRPSRNKVSAKRNERIQS